MPNEVFSASMSIEANLDAQALERQAERAAAIVQKQFDKLRLDIKKAVNQSDFSKAGKSASDAFNSSFKVAKVDASKIVNGSEFSQAGKKAQSAFVNGFTSGLSSAIQASVKKATSGSGNFEAAGKKAGQDYSKGFSGGLRNLDTSVSTSKKSLEGLVTGNAFAGAEKATAAVAENLASAGKNASALQNATAAGAALAAPVATLAAPAAAAGAGAIAAEEAAAGEAAGGLTTKVEQLVNAQRALTTALKNSSTVTRAAADADRILEQAKANLRVKGIDPVDAALLEEAQRLVAVEKAARKTNDVSKALAGSQESAAKAANNFNKGLEKSSISADASKTSLGGLLKTAVKLGAVGGAALGGFAVLGIKQVANVERQNKALASQAEKQNAANQKALKEAETSLAGQTTNKGKQAQQQVVDNLKAKIPASAADSRKAIQQFADVSDFSFEQVNDAVLKLSNGLKIDLKAGLSILNDVASAGFTVGASAEQIDRFTTAIIQIGAKGKVSSEELNQLAETGIVTIGDVQAQIAKDTGKTVTSVQDSLQKGAISSAVGIKAVDEVLKTNAGNVNIASGNYQTLTGAISAFFDKIQQATAGGLAPFSQILRASGPLVDQLATVIKDGLGPGVVALAKAFFSAVDGFKGASGIAASIKSVFEGLAPIVKTLTETFIALVPTFQNLGATLTNVLPAFNAVLKVVNALHGPLGFLLQLFLEFKAISFINDIIAKAFVGLTQKIVGITLGFKGTGTAAQQSMAQASAALEKASTNAQVASAAVKEMQLQLLGVGSTAETVSVETTSGFSRIVSAVNILSAALKRVDADLLGVAAANTKVGLSAAAAIPEVEALALAETEVGGAGVLGGVGTAAKTGLGSKILSKGKSLLGKVGIGKGVGTVATEATGAAEATGALTSGLSALGSALPIIGTTAVVAFTLYSNAAEKAKQKAEELIAVTQKGLNIDIHVNVDDIDKAIAGQKQLIKDTPKRGILAGLENDLQILSPFNKNTIAEQDAQRDSNSKFLKDLQKIKAQESAVTSQVGTQTGESAQAIFDRAIKAGIDLSDVNLNVTSTVEALLKAFNEAGAAGANAFDNAKTGAAAADSLIKDSIDNLNALAAASDKLKQAREHEADANDKIKDKVKEINDLLGTSLKSTELSKLTNAEILKLLSGQAARIDEIADARDRLKDIERDLTDLSAQRSQAQFDNDRRILDFQPKLLEFADKLKLADIGRTEAALALIDAQKELDKLIKPQFVIDFQATTINGAQTQLANAKEVLKAQKFGQDIEDKKTEALKAQLNVEKAKIGINDAQRGFDQAGRDQADFIRENSLAQTEFNQLIDQLAEKEDSLNRDRTEAGTNLDKILTGQVGLVKDVTDKQKDLTGLIKDAATAADATKRAYLELRQVVATIKDDQDAIKKANKDLFDFLGGSLIPGELGLKKVYDDQLKTLQDQTAEKVKQLDLSTAVTDADKAAALAAANTIKNSPSVSKNNLSIAIDQGLLPSEINPNVRKVSIEQANAIRPFIQELLRGATGTNGIALGPLARDPQQNAEFVNTIIREILNTPGSDIADILKKIARQLGIRLPGFKTGTVQDFGTESLARLHGVEAVLPLQSPVHLQRLLSNPKVLGPILDAMPRISLPTAQGSQIAVQKPPSLAVTNSTRSVPQNKGAADAVKERKLLAHEIGKSVAEALIAAGKTDGEPVNVTINLPPASGNTQVDSRNLARELQRRILGG